MLEIYIPGYEIYDEIANEFTYISGECLKIEYSLIAISKWESKFKVPFFNKKEFTTLEFMYFIECMTIGKPRDKRIYSNIDNEIVLKIHDYINDPYSATTLKTDNKAPNREVITSELVYYWMAAAQIPFECEKWNINRLMKLLGIASIKSQPPKKMGKKQLAKHNSSLNASRRQALGTKG